MKCKQCGKEFQAERSTAEYCSAACRVMYNRVSVTDKLDVTVRPVTLKAPSGRIRTVCHQCPICQYPDWKGELMYPEDKDGVPYCNSEGSLTDRNRELLSRKPNELKSIHAPQTGPYA